MSVVGTGGRPVSGRTRAVEPADLPATELVRLFRTGELSPVDAMRMVLARVGALNDELNAYCLVDEAAALSAARAAEKRYRCHAPLSPLDGVPVAVKDLLAVRGWPTRRGSLASAEQPAQADAPAVARLREAGTCLVGKTTTSEYGWKAVTENPLTGTTRNPWDPGRTCGGSSGGSAVAAATGMATIAVGTDAGGSVRIPASLCGLVGVKPTYGAVPAWPPNSFSGLSQAGPLARSVADAVLLLSVIGRPHPSDWAAAPRPSWELAIAEPDLRRVRMLLATDALAAVAEPEVAAGVRAAARVLEGLGASIEEAPLDLGEVAGLFRTVWLLALAGLVAGLSPDRRALLDPRLLDLGEQGMRLDGATIARVEQQRFELGGRCNALHETYDVLLLPTLPVTAFPVGRDVPEGFPAGDALCWASYCYPYNLTGQPAASLPCGLSSAGLPIGVQLVGRRHRDALLLRVAGAYERARGWRLDPVTP